VTEDAAQLLDLLFSIYQLTNLRVFHQCDFR